MLVLTITKEWYDMIRSGEKKEEYREIKPFYTTRFTNVGLLDEKGEPTHKRVKIKLRNGYAKWSPYVVMLCTLDIKKGKPEWGAVPKVEYSTLKVLFVGQERRDAEPPNKTVNEEK